ncbi:SPOR domain-containing protein [Marinomonas ostreistagni]|uniref:SPOR domain-containing protein n=1 Tax=Marinomonas ostreistagni TaxID=359209 RepID=UPI001950978E|nr:SPOR domain-containing protein [Marinomonas ostreistagni]MBM6549633.1 SPOR domain-containing protein [Marinomonas ostreistagni]
MKHKVWVMVTGSLLLSGCSVFSQQDQEPSNAQLQAQLEQQQQEWQAMKPQLQRVLALESDLKLLVEALDTVPESSDEITQELTPDSDLAQSEAGAIQPSAALADLDKTEAPTTQEVTDESLENVGRAQFYEPPRTTTATPAPTAARKTDTPKSAEPNYFGVQLAAYANKEQALTGWQTISGRYAEEFAEVAPRVYQTSIKGKQYHKLIVGPFVEKPVANNFCNMLKQMQEECLVTQYQGEPLLTR